MNTTDVILKDRDGVEQTYSDVETITLNGADGTEKTFVYDDGTVKTVLPEVNTDDNGKVLGVVDGIWDKMTIEIPEGEGECSCPTGTIEYPTTITWSNVVPTVTFEVLDFGSTAHKISDETPTKEQLMMADWSISDFEGNNVYNMNLSESNIMIESDNILALRLSPDSNYYHYVICNSAGQNTVNFSGMEITLDVPEVGIYQLYDSGEQFPTDLFGSISYDITEEVNFVQSNWDRNDPIQPDYIKNKPFYSYVEDSAVFLDDKFDYGLIMNETLEFTEGRGDYLNTITFEEGKKYTVIWDGTSYECVGTYYENLDVVGLGNPHLIFPDMEDTEKPFALGCMSNNVIIFTSDADGFHTVKIYLNSDDNWDNIGILPNTSGLNLVGGNTYTIIFDGTEYSCVALSSNKNMTIIGNTFVLSGKDNGVPFIIVEDLINNEFMLKMMTNPTKIKYDVKIIGQAEIIKKINKKFLPLPDWNECDSSSSSYISNRPFYEAKSGTVLFDRTVNCNIYVDEGLYAAIVDEIYISTNSYKIEFDGFRYIIAGQMMDDQLCLNYQDDNVFFQCINGYIENSTMIISTQGNHTLKINTAEDIVKTIDFKYLPDDISSSLLPEVTTDDDGKVLSVSDGVWGANTIPKELPTVTSSDEGKFLRIVGGLPAWTTVLNAEEALF